MMLLRASCALSCAALLTACAGSPPTRYYTLASPVEHESTPSAAPQAAFSLAVGPVTVPEAVNRIPMVVRVGTNELKVSEEHRWAQPLRQEITRAVALNLARLLPRVRIATYGETTGADPDYRLSVDVQRIDASLGGAVSIETQWALRPRSGASGRTGRSAARAEAAAISYEALAAAHASAIESITRDIAAAIEPLAASGTR
jgi:uncharacterized protein